jgi:hypothetical protein
MTCKDCIHKNVCDSFDEVGSFYNFSLDGWDGNICKHFLHATTVPFVIGQPMWKLCTWYHSQAEIVESRVSMIQQKADKSWKMRISNRYGTEDFKAGDVGTCIFLTKEAAEEALATLNTEKASEVK